LLAAGAHEDGRRALRYLQATQQEDGHWPQNMWLDGSPYWNGIQMDETALPILLVDLARREKALSPADVIRFWPMVRRAAGYLVRNGPVSPQDRWEEDPDYSPFTVGAEIAALLAAADLADLCHEAPVAGYLREVADVWHSCIDRWMYASGTDWCNRFGVNGYYVRIASKDVDTPLRQKTVHVKNVEAAKDTRGASRRPAGRPRRAHIGLTLTVKAVPPGAPSSSAAPSDSRLAVPRLPAGASALAPPTELRSIRGPWRRSADRSSQTSFIVGVPG
jgi:Glycosyl hydrolases family 15